MTATHAEFVEAHFTVMGRSGPEYSVRCSFHDDNRPSLRINVEKGVFMCHGCHERGGMKKLARSLGVHYSWNETESQLSLLAAKLRQLAKPQQEQQRFLPESFLDRYLDLSTSYWTERGLSQETIEAFDLGFDPIENAAIIPVRDFRGRLLGITRRFLDKDSPVKYKDPMGFNKSNHLFGSWLASEHESPTLVLTEGPLDAIKVWQAGHPAVAQYGSYLAPAQIRLLRRMGTVTVVTFYDNDAGGKLARAASMGILKKQSASGQVREYHPDRDLRKFFIVKNVSYSNTRAKDPGELSEFDIDRMVRQSVYGMA